MGHPKDDASINPFQANFLQGRTGSWQTRALLKITG